MIRAHLTHVMMDSAFRDQLPSLAIFASVQAVILALTAKYLVSIISNHRFFSFAIFKSKQYMGVCFRKQDQKLVSDMN